MCLGKTQAVNSLFGVSLHNVRICQISICNLQNDEAGVQLQVIRCTVETGDPEEEKLSWFASDRGLNEGQHKDLINKPSIFTVKATIVMFLYTRENITIV